VFPRLLLFLLLIGCAALPVLGQGAKLRVDDDQEMDLVTGEVGLHAAPVIAKDVIISALLTFLAAPPRARETKKATCADSM
jgi:hypothetical protein